MKRKKWLVLLAVVLAVLSVPVVIVYSRSPVLVVTDTPFIALYGADRVRHQQIFFSLTLLRRVKPVMIADSASSDVVVLAVSETDSQPYCVLFPRYLVSAAVRYHEQFPEIPVVILSGHTQASELPAPDGVLCIFRTDIETDLYRAGIFAGILGRLNTKETVSSDDVSQKMYVLWQDRHVQVAGQELFSRGVRESDPESAVLFVVNAAGVPDPDSVSCVVLTLSGADFLENKPKMPLILFSWLNPDMTAKEVKVIFDDSHWALVVPAVEMALNRQAEGKIPSKPVFISGKIADNGTFRALRDTEKKIP